MACKPEATMLSQPGGCVPVGLHAHVDVIVASFLLCKVLAGCCIALGTNEGCVLV
jgi:hypothetical protein